MNGASTSAGAEARALWPIRKAELADVPQLVRMFSVAFRDDPFVEWIVRAVTARVLPVEP